MLARDGGADDDEWISILRVRVTGVSGGGAAIGRDAGVGAVDDSVVLSVDDDGGRRCTVGRRTRRGRICGNERARRGRTRRRRGAYGIALVICATMEISFLTTIVIDLAVPKRRSFSRLIAYVFWLRTRYHCKDDTVYRIKYTTGDTSRYHRARRGACWTKSSRSECPAFDAR